MLIHHVNSHLKLLFFIDVSENQYDEVCNCTLRYFANVSILFGLIVQYKNQDFVVWHGPMMSS